jgi:elongation factor Ts
MADISAAAIRDLREKTGAGMMDCKKALVESNGDEEKAIEWLRKKGLSSAAKRAGKAATEGVIAAKVEGNVGVIAEINCETDFVARNENYGKFADVILEHIAKKNPGYVKEDNKPAGATGEALVDQTLDNGAKVGDFIAENASKMGENVQVTRFARFSPSGSAILESYIHSNAKIGVLLQIECSSDAVAGNAEMKQLAADLALHIAAEAPLYLTREEAPTEVIEKEAEIARTQLRQQGKPEAMLDKIVAGKMEKYYAETVLLEQKFFRGDNPPAVQKLVTEKAKTAGGEAKITRFVRYMLGETAPKES